MRWLLLLVIFACCRQEHKPVSFYYWKTSFRLNGFEKKVLKEQRVQQLYVRYFDIDLRPEDGQPVPVAPIQLNADTIGYYIVPVVYIKNRVFESLDSVGRLVTNVYAAVGDHKEIQFDCDWTESTKDKYFLFLSQYRALTHQFISATIRLHQVKYKTRTGVPPVDRGVLMYYNMSGINPDDVNSIYEKNIANRYNEWIKAYPLALDVALPIFTWGYIIREGKVVKLLNKINFTYFQNDSNFTLPVNNKLAVKQSCFKAGYYFQQHDTIKLEHVSEADLLDIAKQIKQHAGRTIEKVILYDLDSSNIVQYEKDIFNKIMDNID